MDGHLVPPPVVARFMHVCVVCGAGTREGRPANGSMRLFITPWGKNSFTLDWSTVPNDGAATLLFDGKQTKAGPLEQKPLFVQ
jgi:hypothetical protein